MATNRINWLLILQGWAMLWVVIGHSPLAMEGMPLYVKCLYDFAYSFHMPLFMMVSGWLFCLTRVNASKKWTWSSVVKDKFIRLGIPFVVFTIIAMLSKALFPEDMDRPVSFTFSELLLAILYPGRGAAGAMWFISCILWYFILYPLWKFILKYKWLSFLSLIIVIAIHFIRINKLGLGIPILGIGRALEYMVWFYLGLLVCKYDLIKIIMERAYAPILCFFIGAASWVAFRVWGIDFMVTISAIILSLGLAFIADKYYPKAFCTFRDYTYQIFLMSIFFQIAVKMIYKRIDAPYIIFFIMCILAGLYLPVIMSKIIERLNFTPLLLAVGLKKKQ